MLKEINELPQVLLMENVKQVIGQKNIGAFADWVAFLDKLGYHSKWKVINATEFGIPQNRERCFMVSVLGNHYYDFPKPIKLNRKLKNVLENNVDESYYLSERMVDYYEKHSQESVEKKNGFRFSPTNGQTVGKEITTRAGGANG